MADTSAWICGGCGEPEEPSRPLRRACHHCGKVLCRNCAKTFDDGAFAGGLLSSTRRQAVHCKACRDEYHPHLTSR